MDFSFTRSYLLPAGVRVRLRLARGRDQCALQELLRAAGSESIELEAARLTHYDPRRRVVVCASALLDGREQVVGVGAIDVDAETPDTLCVAPMLAQGLPELLKAALHARAGAIACRSAA